MRDLPMPRPVHPPAKNPFADNSLLAQAFDGAVRAYRDRASNLFATDDKALRTSAAGAAFWKGFDGVPAGTACADGTVAFACYCAGRAMADLARRRHPPARKLPPRY